MSGELKTYVWEDILCGYSCGMVVVIAHSEEEAWQLLYEKDEHVWSTLMFDGEVEWDDPLIQKLNPLVPEDIWLRLPILQKLWLREKGITIYKNAVRPKEVTQPDVFVVGGCG